MNKLLVLDDKHGSVYVSVKDDKPETLDNAYMVLFNIIDSNGYYNGTLDITETKLYSRAKAGSASDARRLVCRRSDTGAEYEQVEVEFPINPDNYLKELQLGSDEPKNHRGILDGSHCTCWWNGIECCKCGYRGQIPHKSNGECLY